MRVIAPPYGASARGVFPCGLCQPRIRASTNNVPEPGRVAGPAALLPQRNQIALFQCHDEFAAVATVTILANRHAPDSFVQGGHSARSVCLGCIVAFAGSPSASSNRRISAGV